VLDVDAAEDGQRVDVQAAVLTVAALAGPTTALARPADQVPPPPSSIAASAADEYEELRAAGADAPTSPDIGEDVASGGFDAVSGALGAAAGIVLAITAVALAGGLTRVRPARHHAARS
jgi:hypothetical protein